MNAVSRKPMTKASKPQASRPQPRMSKHGFMLYPAWNRDGKLVWVSIPD